GALGGVKFVLASRDADGIAPHRFVFAEIARADDAAGLAQGIDHLTSDVANVEVTCSLRCDPFQRGREIFLRERRSGRQAGIGIEASLAFRPSDVEARSALTGTPSGAGCIAGARRSLQGRGPNGS